MKCIVCKRKRMIVEGKCGAPTCLKHQYPDMHECSVDPKQRHKDKLKKQLVKVEARKVAAL